MRAWLLIVVLMIPLPAAAIERCGSLPRWAEAAARPRYTFDQQPGSEPKLRSPFGEQAYVTISKHFAFRAGDCCGQPDPAAVARALATLERAYDRFALDGYPRPVGPPTFFLNVYLGNSGQGAPTIDDTLLGYVDTDPLGLPFIVLHPHSFDEYAATPDGDTDADATLVHELFHTVQLATGARYDLTWGWFFEAAATWMETQLLPALPGADYYGGAYLLGGDLALATIVYGDDGDWRQQLHPYGAQLFVRYLADQAGPALIRDVWLDAIPGERPLDGFEKELQRYDLKLPPLFGDFAAHAATLDLPRAAAIQEGLDLLGARHPDAAWIRPLRARASLRSLDLPPQSLGFNVIQLEPSELTEHLVVFEDRSGQGDDTFEVRVVRQRGEARTYLPVPIEQARGEIVITDVDAAESIFVTIAMARDIQGNARFNYDARFDPVPVPAPGCTTSGSPGTSWFALLLLLAALGAVKRRALL